MSDSCDTSQAVVEKRRSFLTIIRTAFTLAAASVALPFVFTEKAKVPTKQMVGTTDELFATSKVVQVQVADTPVILVQQEQTVKAFSALCTHAHCTVQYSANSKTIVCPCHGGEFNLDGTVLKSPPTKPLTSLTTRVHNNNVFVVLPSA